MKQRIKQMLLGLICVSLIIFCSKIVVMASSEGDLMPNPSESAYQENKVQGGEKMEEEVMEGVIVTITGTINSDYQLVDNDGTVYEIGKGNVGDEMLRYIGENVKANGKLVQLENESVLFVITYEILK